MIFYFTHNSRYFLDKKDNKIFQHQSFPNQKLVPICFSSNMTQGGVNNCWWESLVIHRSATPLHTFQLELQGFYLCIFVKIKYSGLFAPTCWFLQNSIGATGHHLVFYQFSLFGSRGGQKKGGNNNPNLPGILGSLNFHSSPWSQQDLLVDGCCGKQSRVEHSSTSPQSCFSVAWLAAHPWCGWACIHQLEQGLVPTVPWGTAGHAWALQHHFALVQ